jgi:hypothetical protein
MAASVGGPPLTVQFENPPLTHSATASSHLALFVDRWAVEVFDPHIGVTYATEVPEILYGSFYGIAQNLGDVAVAVTPLNSEREFGHAGSMPRFDLFDRSGKF